MQLKINPISFKANKMSTTQAKHINEKLSKAKNVDIICHNTTDRDCANSALAMWDYLNSKGIEARVIISQQNPELLNLRTTNFNMVQANNNKELSKIKPDLALCVDFGAEERVNPNVLKHIKEAPVVLGFDHHCEVDLSRGDFVQFERSLSDDEVTPTKANFYSDLTAKSATCVIYRFLEASGEEIDNLTAYDLFLGMADDTLKRNLIKCDGEKGTITAKKALIEDKNAFEIFNALKEKLTDEQIASIAKAIDVLSSLSPEQEAFKDSLNNRLQYSQNGKIAYVEIAPDDEEWEKLGGDNIVTSRIMNNFRQQVLAQNNDVEIAIIFYESQGTYRLSAHTKEPNLLKFFQYIEDNAIEDFTNNSGGHPTRGGGGLNSTDKNKCSTWARNIITCDKYFEK
jgi:uncharacterized protein YciU (UPF0263 family)